MEEVNFNETKVQETVESEKALNCDSNEPKKSKTPAMFKAGIALMCATSALSLGAIGACGFLGYKLYKNQKNQNSNPQDSMGSVVTNTGPSISVSDDGYWVINGEKTQFKAEVADGEDGANGVSVVNASIVNLDKWGITTQIQFKMSDNSYIVTAPQTQIMSEHFYEAEDMSDILTLTEGYGISKIKLSKNVYLSASIDFSGDTIIDLNRKSLEYVAINPLKVAENSSLTFKNGSVTFKNSVGVSIQGENAELSFEKVTVSATSAVAETLENNASINLTNSTVQTVQAGYGASRAVSAGSLFIVKGENANFTVTGSKFETNKSIVSASENATEFKIVVKETKINTTAPILDINTDEVVPTLDIDNSTMQNSTVTELNTSPITSGSFNVDPTMLGATLEGVEQFNVNGSTVLAADLEALVDMVESGSTINLTRNIQLETGVVVTKELTLNLGNYTISTPTITELAAIEVNAGGKLTINAGEEGGINSASQNNDCSIAVWARNGGEAIINGGFYTNVGALSNLDNNKFANNEMIYTSGNGSKITINDGFFMGNILNEKWGTRYTLNKHDSTDSEIIVNGGFFFGYNPAESHSENPVENFVAENKLVGGFNITIPGEQMGDILFDGMVYAVTSASNFEEVVKDGITIYEYEDSYGPQKESIAVNYIYLNGDVVLNDGIVIAERELTLDLNTHTISTPTIDELAAIEVNQYGYLIINAKEEGGINSASQNNDCSIAVWARNGGYAVINGGTYTNVGALSNLGNNKFANNEMIYTSGNGSTIIINDGKFIGNYENEKWGTRYTVNKHDSTNSTIVVNGGSFYKFNPSESLSENPVANFVAPGHMVIKTGDTYTVVEGTLQEVVNKATANSTIILTEDIVIAGGNVDSEEAKIYISKNLTVDLKGFSINANYGEGVDNFFVFRVIANGILTINDSVGGGSISAYAITGGYALYVDGGELIINGGSYSGNPTAVNVRTGKATINNGLFASSKTGEYRYVVNCIDANYKNETAIVEINGGAFVNYNPASNLAEGPETNFVSEGHIVVSDGETYVVVSADDFVEYVNMEEVTYISLHSDIVLKDGLVIERELTLDLNNYTISTPEIDELAAFKVNTANGRLTINAKENGGINSASQNNDCSIAVWARNGGQVVINGGTYTNKGAYSDYGNGKYANNELIYVSETGVDNSSIVINGGTFIGNSENAGFGTRYTLNKLDRCDSTIKVYGGTFVGYNPAESRSENPVDNFVADGYKVVVDGNNYTVVAE